MNDQIINTVRKYLRVKPENLFSKCRKREYVEARYISMYFMMKQQPKQKLRLVGAEFDKDHSSVCYAINTVNDLIDTNKAFRAKIEDIAELLKN